MRLALWLLLAPLAWAQPAVPVEGHTLDSLLRQAGDAFDQRDYAKAVALFETGMAEAGRLGLSAQQAGALVGLGRIDNARGDYTQARERLAQALQVFESSPDLRREAARARNELAYTEWASGNRDSSLKLYKDALATFRELGDEAEAARVFYNVAFLTPPGAARLRLLEEAHAAARAVNNTRLEGKTLHTWGDALYTNGDMRAALEKLSAALPLLASPGDRGDRARVNISLGRLHATHCRFEAAVPYFEAALRIHRELGEKQGIVYALNSLEGAYRSLGDIERAAKAGEEAVAVARSTASPSLLSGTLVNHARVLLARRRDAEALEHLKEAARLDPESAGSEFLYMADVHHRAGRKAESLHAAETAVERSRRANNLGYQAQALHRRARALDAAGDAPGALADTRAALALVETLRAQAGPTDFLKRGYAEAWRELTAFAVNLFFRNGLVEEALEAAETGRARAFLDLMATRSLADRVEGPLTFSGEEPHLASLATIAPATAAIVRQRARETSSTVISYWLGPEAVFIWVVNPSGAVDAVRVPLPAGKLESLVRAAARPALPSVQPMAPAAVRGDRPATAARPAADPLRELYRLLVEPVARFLPAAGSSLTVVADGALHRVSFPALRSAGGRYLLEDYAVAYLPSAAVVSRRPEPTGQGYLFVADPTSLPPGPGGRALPPLPGARKESALSARALRGVPVRVLAGSEAYEAGVRGAVSAPKVLHFATHGLLDDQRPFESFLALGRRSEQPDDDGRLTVREIYELELQADLVVLSACRTADGAVTGDGINGMTRAFLYAGARGVIATLWDVADEPTQRLASRFYDYLAKGHPAGEALRRAQLDLLAALRAGQVRAESLLGTVVLEEHPAFWAGFVLVRLPS